MPEMKLSIQRKQIVIVILVILCALLLLVGELAATENFQDYVYLTPIPENTRRAFNLQAPITNKLEAAIAGQIMSNAGHFSFLTTPIIRTVEEMSLGQARDRLALTNSDQRSPDTKVWLVIMQGDIQIIPPPFDSQGKRTTPFVFHDSCGYVLFEAQNPSGGMGTIGGIDCPAR